MHSTHKSRPNSYSYRRYLAAKKTVDDRALNLRVWQGLAGRLPRAVGPDAPVRVVELGAGIGTMVERAVERGLLTRFDYTAVDVDPAYLQEADTRLCRWAEGSGITVDSTPGHLALSGKDVNAHVELEAADAFDFISREGGLRTWDLLIAHAFLDLVDVPSILPGMLSLLRPGGLFYLTINFDGLTAFEPEIDPSLDPLIERLYHRTMDDRVTSGGSRTGRRLLAHLTQLGVELLDVGPSDWVVYPGPKGYEADKAYFLHYVVNTVWEALRGNPDLDEDALAHWIDRRHAQIETGELHYIAHQLDLLGRV